MKEKDHFYTELRSLLVPIAIQSFMLALVSATDAVMLGLIDQNSMAAVSQAGQIQFFLNLLVMGLSIGVGIMTAQYWGKRDTDPIEMIAPVGLRIITFIGGAMMLAAFFAPRLLMSALTNDASLIPLGAEYLRAVAPSYFLCGISQVYFALLKNTGHADKSSAVGSAAVIINIVLNAVLIFGLLRLPALGIRGAAYATDIARLLELVCAFLINRKYGHVRLLWSRFFKRADRLLFGDFMRYTSPVIGASLVWGVAFMLYSVYMGYLGADAVAANSICSISKNLISCLIRGVAGGAGIMVGNLLGANRIEQARIYGARLTKLSIVTGIVTGGVLILISPILLHFVSLSETASEYLKYMLIFCGINIMAQSVNTTVLDGIFGAGGDSKFDMQGNLAAMWCFTVPLGFLAAFVFKLPVPVVYCIVNLDEIVKLPAVYIHYKKYIWLRNITREINAE